MKYEVVIGLEVHVELDTKTKLFCSCPNSFSTKANQNVCEGCLGLPGTLPYLNSEAVEQALKASLALNCEIALESRFDRKNYFYPDIPKGYQISQFFIPIGSRGYLDIEDDRVPLKRINITRVHIEEDAGKLVHSLAGDHSMVDFNRAGVPLVEIVTEPDLRSPAESRCYLEMLKSILQYSKVSDCKMEEGSLRCDANISLRPFGDPALGAKTELKNMNSFRAVEKGLEYEIKRQSAILDKGEKVIPQTRRWDEASGTTIAMRGKLQAHDYRCFVDPELSPIFLTAEHVEEVRKSLPEFAVQKVKRYVQEYGLPEYDARVITSAPELSCYFEDCLAGYNNPKILSNWIMGDFLAYMGAAGQDLENLTFTADFMIELMHLIDKKIISGKIAKQVMEKSFQNKKSPKEIVEEEGLLQISDESELEKQVEQILTENPASVEDYRNGKKKAIGFLVGQIMKATKGKANPQLVNELLKKKLK